MENVMNFLADNYIWFFVAAGILCFALIGFVIESRKKQKNEFKGESIEESNTTQVNSTLQTEVSNPVQEVQPVTEVSQPQEVQMETPIQPVNPTVMESTSTPEVNSTTSLEDTMEINDIPMAVESLDVPKATPIEFYDGPISMPSNTEEMKEAVIEPVQDSTSMEESMSEPVVTPTMSDTISYEQTPITPINEPVSSLEENNTFSSINGTEVAEEKKEEQPTNIFDNLN